MSEEIVYHCKGSKSNTKHEQNTNITTSTTTRTRDIGLTGVNAVDIIKASTTETGKAFSQLNGGALAAFNTAQHLADTAANQTTGKIVAQELPVIAAIGGAAIALVAILRK